MFGWGCGITAYVLWRRFGWDFIQPAIFAGLAYTVGAIVLVSHSPTLVTGVIGPHELWHVAVLSGLGLRGDSSSNLHLDFNSCQKLFDHFGDKF